MRRMIRAVELFIGLRYLRAKRRTRFVSFISFISLAGIALGVAALIVILSVMNGFEGELRTRLLSMSAHGHVTGDDGRLANWQAVRPEMLKTPGVAAAAPVVEMEGMIQTGRLLAGVLGNGVIPELESTLSGEHVHHIAGGLERLKAGSR
jgi:lipoprotein-releasing system permease protein